MLNQHLRRVSVSTTPPKFDDKAKKLRILYLFCRENPIGELDKPRATLRRRHELGPMSQSVQLCLDVGDTDRVVKEVEHRFVIR